jgi:hypothetical protein
MPRPVNPILAAVLAEAAEGYHPSGVWAEPAGPGRWRITITRCDYVPLGEGGDLPRHAVTVARNDMPQGVACTGADRAEDKAIDGLRASAEAVETWIREVAEVGQAPDWAKIGPAYFTRPRRWLPPAALLPG